MARYGRAASKSVKSAMRRRKKGTLRSGRGGKGGRVKSLCDMCLVVPSEHVQYIEDSHLSVMHAIFCAVRQRMLNSADRE